MKKFCFCWALAIVLGFFATPVMAQDKGKPEEKKDDSAKQKDALKEEIETLKKQNNMLQLRLRMMQRVLELYRKRIQERSNPVEQYRREARMFFLSLQQAFMKKGIKGALEVVVKTFQKFFGPKRTRPVQPRTNPHQPQKSKTMPTNASKDWLSSLDEGKKQAAQNNKPLLVKVGASW